MNSETLSVDVLVIGSGLAGLAVTLHILDSSMLNVAMVTKSALMHSNSTMAQGGVASVIDTNPYDSPESHIDDTLRSGGGLCDENAVSAIVKDGHAMIKWLERHGVFFDRNDDGLDVALEGGHSHARVLHMKDATGRGITSALIESLLRKQEKFGTQIRLLENALTTHLLMNESSVCGAHIIKDNKSITVSARYVVLATGGAGQVYERTTNPSIATADGIAIAFRAGAEVADMEFVQFHPTALHKPGAPAFLVSEAVRGAGAILTDKKGERFVTRFDERGELATRDIVSKAIHQTMVEQGTRHVFLDLRPVGKEKLTNHFTNIVETLGDYGFDPLNEPVPVSPAAHYLMGGVATDLRGRTNLGGLYAVGECASTGLHGANRLASNSLLEAGVMGLRAARDITARSHFEARLRPRVLANSGVNSIWENIALPADTAEFQRQMIVHAGMFRKEDGLRYLRSTRFGSDNHVLDGVTRAYGEANSAVDIKAFEAANIFLVGSLIASFAIDRKESRGAHARNDYPNPVAGYCHSRRMRISDANWSIRDASVLAPPPVVAVR